MATIATGHSELDASVSAYVEWHRHEQSVRSAYEAWSGAEPAERSRRYAAYIEELDREQRACELYAAAVAKREAPADGA